MEFSLLFPEEPGEKYFPEALTEEFRSDMKLFFEGINVESIEKFGIISVLSSKNSKSSLSEWVEHISFHSKTAAAYVFVPFREYRDASALTKLDIMTETVLAGVKMLADELPSFDFSGFKKDFLKFNKANREKYIKMTEIKKRGRPRKNIE